MSTLNIISKAIRHAFMLISSLFPTCNEKTLPAVKTEPNIIAVPKIDLGDTSRYVKLQIDMNARGKPDFSFTDLLYDKSKGFLLMKDDGINTDYTIVYKVLNGGIINGKRYPGFTFTDGTGKNINYKYSFAVNPNDGHNSSSNVTTWAQMMEMINKGHGIMNHTIFHGGADKLKAIKDAEKNMWLHTRYRMTELVIPSNEEGFVETGLNLGYHLISSEFGEPAPDGNNDKGNENISWGSYIKTSTQRIDKVLVSRWNLGDKWNVTELQNGKDFINHIFNSPDKHKKLIGTAFSHGPFADHKESVEIFNDFMTYIKNHPLNRDSAWITSSKEMMDFFKTKKAVVIKSEVYDYKTGKYTIILDMNKVDPNVIWRNLSLKITGGIINNVTATGVNQITFNTNTGLINLYKMDRSKVKNPFKDILPPQIISLTAKGNIVSMTYDKPVTQKKYTAYEISGNTVLGLQGSGQNWRLILKTPVAEGQLFYYRMQRGDAVQKGNPTMRICTYAGLPIKV